MKTRMEAFAAACFATHPDGRIAARIDPLTVWPWYCSEPDGFPGCVTDERMAADGWVPLGESRLPRVVTDEMVDAAVNANSVPAKQVGIYGYMRHILTAALSAAPTTGEDDVDWKARAEKAEQDRDEYKDERDKYRAQAQLLATMYEDRLAADNTMTAREYLEKAWEAARVPADGIIPAEVEYMVRFQNGAYSVRKSGPEPIEAKSAYERRLLDPPAPTRPEGAEALQVAVENYLRARLTMPVDEAEPLADFLAERGVRTPEDGAS